MTAPWARLAALALAAGCVQGIEDPAPEPKVDEKFFECQVQPRLTKSCAHFACHGDGQRYFRLYARNRLRLGGTEAQRNEVLSNAERAHNFAAARAFVDAEQLDQSLILMKPLDQVAGGYYHGGAAEYNKGDVYLSRDDADFKVLVAWVNGATEDPSCTEPGSDL